jgi:plastocyanin
MKVIIGSIVVVISASTVFFFMAKDKTSDEVQTSASIPEAGLTVQAQDATSTVIIDSVTLPQAGFLAVRSIDSGRLGQIVEISKYLTAGTHTNIKIALGDFYEGNEELIVMAYTDSGSDKVFNDFDQPLEIKGVPLSVYVAAGTSVPAAITTNTANTDALHTMGSSTMATIRYTKTGYEPKELDVPIGTMVEFVNESGKKMWVASNDHPGHTILPTFDQFKPGDQYTYIFDRAGNWHYHDHLNPTAEGVITVKAK